VGACNLKKSKNHFVILELMGVGVWGWVVQGRGASAQWGGAACFAAGERASCCSCHSTSDNQVLELPELSTTVDLNNTFTFLYFWGLGILD
jgi:hypothetical protein